MTLSALDNQSFPNNPFFRKILNSQFSILNKKLYFCPRKLNVDRFGLLATTVKNAKTRN